ncbi:MAG: DUF4824 family protein [Deltaproteobacteria bacterium]|nr:DUF4824 family protein [Deltaproteobacteria bacterium]
MRRYGFLGAILFLLLVNAVLFFRVAYNRWGVPQERITLTGREIEMEGGVYQPGTKMVERKRPTSIRLKYSHSCPWFDAAKLESIGFDCRVPSDKDAFLYDLKVRPRRTFAVLEYEGRAYETWRHETEEKIEDLEDKWKRGEIKSDSYLKDMKDSLVSNTRLFPIDVGNDPGVLRQRYPDRRRLMIAPVVARMISGGAHGAHPQGTISLQVNSIYLSDPQRTRLAEILRQLQANKGKPDYPGGWLAPEQRRRLRFTICYGRTYEPWVEDISLQGEPP